MSMRIGSNRTRSICAFSALFAYLLAFLFEGQVLYSLLGEAGRDAKWYILSAIVAHFTGQFSCGYFCKSGEAVKKIVLLCMSICFLFSNVFFFPVSIVWIVALIINGYASGCAVAAWGYFLKTFTPKDERLQSCADMLIYSNIVMILVNIVAVNLSIIAGLIIAMLCLAAGIILTCLLPVIDTKSWTMPDCGNDLRIRKPMGVLFLFVAIITVNSGLMYQVINPAFEHLKQFASWYWAVPYIAALIIMRNLPRKMNRNVCLYVGMGMIMSAFIFFMLLKRGVTDYLIVDTLMLGACGIFDLFWWSIIGEMLEYAKNPVKVFVIGLSANVFGVLCGDLIGVTVTLTNLPSAQITVIALCVVCITVSMLPWLNNQLASLLESHAYLTAYSILSATSPKKTAFAVCPLDPLTEREAEILTLLLDGKTNKEIASLSFISENTVKTHLKSIYSKYHVTSRAELISLLLRSKEC